MNAETKAVIYRSRRSWRAKLNFEVFTDHPSSTETPVITVRRLVRKAAVSRFAVRVFSDQGNMWSQAHSGCKSQSSRSGE